MRYFTPVAALAMLLLASCSSKESATTATDNQEEIPVVSVQEVSAQDVPQLFDYTAQTEADKVNNISSSSSLRIKSILVDEGQKVAKGQQVVVLDDVNATNYQLQVDNALAQLENVKIDYNRAKQLYEIGGGTKQQVDQYQLQLVTAQNNLANARRALANAKENNVLTSPVSGVVTARNYDPGDMTGSLPVLTVAQVNPMKIVINVSETEYSLIHLGMSADIRFDTYGDEAFTGVISKILPTVDPQSRTFGVEITLDNASGKVLPGMFARVELNLGVKNHVVVPDRAVVKQQGSGNQFVYVYDPKTSTVAYRQVTLGQRLGTTYEVIEGLEAGSQVVVVGQNALADGKKVTLKK